MRRMASFPVAPLQFCLFHFVCPTTRYLQFPDPISSLILISNTGENGIAILSNAVIIVMCNAGGDDSSRACTWHRVRVYNTQALIFVGKLIADAWWSQKWNCYLRKINTRERYAESYLTDPNANDKISFFVLSCIRSPSVEFTNDYVLRDTTLQVKRSSVKDK